MWVLCVVLMSSALAWFMVINPWMTCVLLSVFCFLGLMKHMMLMLLLLEFLSVMLVYTVFNPPVHSLSSILIFMLIFTSIASEGAVSLSLFLVSARTSSDELSSNSL